MWVVGVSGRGMDCWGWSGGWGIEGWAKGRHMACAGHMDRGVDSWGRCWRGGWQGVGGVESGGGGWRAVGREGWREFRGAVVGGWRGTEGG